MLAEFEVETGSGLQLIDITAEVLEKTRELSAKTGKKEGIVLVHVPHATAAIIAMENEPGLKEDMKKLLEKIVPRSEKYQHNRIDDNAHSHLRASLLSPSLAVPLHEGRPLLGTWQSIILCEFDVSPRKRRVTVTIV